MIKQKAFTHIEKEVIKLFVTELPANMRQRILSQMEEVDKVGYEIINNRQFITLIQDQQGTSDSLKDQKDDLELIKIGTLKIYVHPKTYIFKFYRDQYQLRQYEIHPPLRLRQLKSSQVILENMKIGGVMDLEFEKSF